MKKNNWRANKRKISPLLQTHRMHLVSCIMDEQLCRTNVPSIHSIIHQRKMCIFDLYPLVEMVRWKARAKIENLPCFQRIVEYFSWFELIHKEERRRKLTKAELPSWEAWVVELVGRRWFRVIWNLALAMSEIHTGRAQGLRKQLKMPVATSSRSSASNLKSTGRCRLLSWSSIYGSQVKNSSVKPL